jgi:hypothetical protein
MPKDSISAILEGADRLAMTLVRRVATRFFEWTLVNHGWPFRGHRPLLPPEEASLIYH